MAPNFLGYIIIIVITVIVVIAVFSFENKAGKLKMESFPVI